MKKIKKVTGRNQENYPVERVAHYYCYELCEWEPNACTNRCGTRPGSKESHFDAQTYNGWFGQLQQ